MYKYKDKKLSSLMRAKDLLSLMTIDEKIDQLSLMSLEELLKAKEEGKELPLCNGVFCQMNDPKVIDEINEWYINKSRLGIPVMLYFEALHGLGNKNATVFPQCAGIGGSFNRDLVYKMAQHIGKETRATGTAQVFAPDLDIPRDPRWGRMQECYGEDPYLVGEMGYNYVKGVQENGVAATVKHFIAYGLMEGGINLTPAHVGEREIREVMLEPFKKCIDAGAYSLMPAYNEIDGIPVHISKKWLRDVLREELGFEGTVITDWGASNMLKNFHKVSSTALDAGERILAAGVDIEGPSAYGYGSEFRKAAKNGEIDIALIDEAVLRILELKFKLGLFDMPYSKTDYCKIMHSSNAVEVSRKLDEESILLLKNDGILPLDENKIGKVAVIGNNAVNSFLGDYSWRTDNCIDFVSGMKMRLGEERVLYSKGCNNITCDKELVNKAVEQAKKADVVFLVLGDNTTVGGGIGGGEFAKTEVTCSEGYDTHDLNLPPSQKELFNEIVKLGKPIVLVLYAGRPYTLKDDIENVNGFMFSFGGGEQSGVAFANLIFGDITPSAKLSVSFPQTVGHLPSYYNYKVSARGSFYKKPGSPENPGRDYVLSSPDAWLPFGYGLSYTRLEYSNLCANKCGDKIKVTVDIENKGKYDINESVLLFVSAQFCPVTPFVKQLRNFTKVYIKAGEKKTAELYLSDEDFTYIDENMQCVKNNEVYTLQISDLSVDIKV